MNFTRIELSLIALLPAVALCLYMYYKDKVEKEPIWLLALLFVAGGVSYIPAYFGEDFAIGLLDKAFKSSKIVNSALGQLSWKSDSAKYAYFALCAFVAVALIEELVRWLVLYFITHKNKEFNCLFDGVVYSVFVSMGFSLATNIRYAMVDGWDTFLLRLLDNVPGQLFFGILMGYFYTLWHVHSLADEAEERLISEGKVQGEKIRYPLAKLSLSIIVPIIAHGTYSFMRLCDSNAVTIIYYALVAVVFAVCFVGIAKLAKKDTSDSSIVNAILRKHHPEYAGEVFVDDQYLGLDDVDGSEDGTVSEEGEQ